VRNVTLILAMSMREPEYSVCHQMERGADGDTRWYGVNGVKFTAFMSGLLVHIASRAVSGVAAKQMYVMMDNSSIHRVKSVRDVVNAYASWRLAVEAIQQVCLSSQDPDVVAFGHDIHVPPFVTVVYMPPYSPVLNPTELAFSILKHAACKERFQTFGELVRWLPISLSLLSADFCRAFFQHCWRFLPLMEGQASLFSSDQVNYIPEDQVAALDQDIARRFAVNMSGSVDLEDGSEDESTAADSEIAAWRRLDQIRQAASKLLGRAPLSSEMNVEEKEEQRPDELPVIAQPVQQCSVDRALRVLASLTQESIGPVVARLRIQDQTRERVIDFNGAAQPRDALSVNWHRCCDWQSVQFIVETSPLLPSLTSLHVERLERRA
jgi:transposase